MKIKDFQRKLREKGIDVAVLYNMETNAENPNMRYLANFSGYGFLIVPATKSPFLVVPLLDVEKALKSRTKFFIAKKNFMEIISKKLKSAKNLGIESKKFSYFAARRFAKQYKTKKFEDISEILDELRMIKASKEIKIIKEASKISNKILVSCINNFKNFRTEKDIYNYLRIKCLENDVEPSFDFVVASGRNPASPHHEPNNKKLSKGFCVIDFGIKYKGYCTDTTRTVYIGKPSKKDMELYNIVLNAQKNVIQSIKIGNDFSDLDKRVRKDLGKYEKKFIHSLGHGVGIEVHESPNISSFSKTKIQEGIYFTIEPGIYFPLRLGIRIEDDILIENKKVINLTTIDKNLISVKPKAFK